MVEYLYILISVNLPCFKVGISNNVRKRLLKIETDFGKISHESSLVYSCNNRKLLENIEHGIHAYLDNFAFHPSNLGGGSSEWFAIESLEKCKSFIDLYLKELDGFNFEENLNIFLKKEIDFIRERDYLEETGQFLNSHTEMIHKISNFLKDNIESFRFEKINGNYHVWCENIDVFSIEDLPIFQWVKKENNQLIFDTQVYNKWKKSRVHEVHRGLVEIRFFNEFTWNNFKAMID